MPIQMGVTEIDEWLRFFVAAMFSMMSVVLPWRAGEAADIFVVVIAT